MHAFEPILQAVVASDENTRSTIEYLKYQLSTSCEILSSEGDGPPHNRPDAFRLGAELPLLEFVSLFLNHIRAHAEAILAAAQAAWDQEQRKAQEVASRNTGKLPSERTHVVPTQRQVAHNGQTKLSSDLQATAGRAADSAALLDLDSFPALGSSLVPSAKNDKASARVPAGALMRIVSQAPLHTAEKSAAGSVAGSRRRLAPTPVAQITRDENFTARQQAAADAKKGPRRKLAPTPVTTTPQPSKSFSSAVSFASAASHAQPNRSVQGEFTGWPAASPAVSGASQTPVKAPYASAMSSLASPAASTWPAISSSAVKQRGPVTPASSKQPSTGAQVRQQPMHCSGEGSSWNSPPGGQSKTGKSSMREDMKEDALSRRIAGLGLSSPGPSSSQNDIVQRKLDSPWGKQPSFVSYSEQATLGSITLLAPDLSGSFADSGYPGRSTQVSTPEFKQSCVGSNEIPMSRSQRAPVTPGSAQSVTSRLAKTDHAATTTPRKLDGRAAHCSGSALDFAGTPQEPGQAAASDQPAERNMQEPFIAVDGSAAGCGGSVDNSEAPAELAPHARRTAAVHAMLLSCAASCSLAAELELLLHLLALPAGVRLQSTPEEQQPLFSSGAEAASYACAVLQEAGHAVEGLSVPAQESLLSSRQVAQQAPDLARRLRAVLDRRRSSDAGGGRGYEQGLVGSVFELHAFNSDGLQKRSKEEQQRISNQEAVRDEWFCLLKDALASANPLGRSAAQPGVHSRGGHTLMDKGAPQLRDGEAAVLGVLVEGAGRLVRGVAAGNLGAFARLFCAAVLQAAATGEALLDRELGALAARDPSRFSRLNQRLQGQSGTARGAPRMQPPLYRAHSPGPSASHVSSNAEAGWSQNRSSQQQHRRKPAKGLDDGSAASLEVAAMFPPAQRLFVLFLEAADSHRFNTHLTACMQERMKELLGEALADRGSGTAQKCEQALALATLAAFLSYLTFGTAGGGTNHRVMDVEGEVAAAARKGALLWTLPWVNCYLWFLQPAAPLAAPLSPHMLTQLSLLRAAAALKPAHESFGPAALCLRCLLDELLERLPPPLPDSEAPCDLLVCLNPSTAPPAVIPITISKRDPKDMHLNERLLMQRPSLDRCRWNPV
ncbi:hypothetical protein COCOBI_07-2420 [Coccomyxa sp. Obi]|nr:hypothetical protein COCOBI_07-2420 [Coccomyxa sp. Obi]